MSGQLLVAELAILIVVGLDNSRKHVPWLIGLRNLPPLGDDVEDIGRPDLEVLRASEAKNCDLLIEIGGRMDEVCESCHKVF